jgi:lipopolysaccharide transport system permease protein
MTSNLQTSPPQDPPTVELPLPPAMTEYARGEGAFQEIWSHRELLFFLAWRDVKVRYKQTGLGILWAIMQPLLTMAIFTVIFSRFAHVGTGGVPAPIFYFSGLVPWLYISVTVSMASMSLVTNMSLLTKIYFPRVMLPAAVALSSLVDFLVASLLMAGFLLYYHVPLTSAVLIWPLLVVQMLLLALGMSLFLSALNVKFRDVKYAVPFVVQIWMYLSPVIYPATILPVSLRRWGALNPADGLIQAFRHCFVPSSPVNWEAVAISAAVTVVLFSGALFYFQSSERAFADVI